VTEIWKDIPSYPDYQVSNTGFVRSKDRMIKAHSKAGERFLPGRIVQQKLGNNCYNVSLKNAEGYTSKSVRRLVWMAFRCDSPNWVPIFGESNGSYVMNKDGDITNNAIGNLELKQPNPANRDKNRRRRIKERSAKDPEFPSVYSTVEDRVGCARLGNRLLRMAW